MLIMTRQRRRLIVRTAIAAVIAIMVLDRGALAQGAANAKVELPPYQGALKDDYYPTDARLHSLQGRALVEFNVNARGVPEDVVVVQAEPAREFDQAARRLVRNLRYQVPANWAQGSTSHRFRMGVRYQVVQCINLSHCESEPRDPPADYDAADRTYVLTAQRRVVTLDRQSVAPPAVPPPPAPLPPAPALRPRVAPAVPSEEPIYPPG
jgi:TonB family protein